jgi:hypothetical protein
MLLSRNAGTVTSEDRRKHRLTVAFNQALAKLKETRREDYQREADYQRVLTMRRNKVAGLKKMMEGDECETGRR